MSSLLLPRKWWQEFGGEIWVMRSMSENVSNQCIFYERELHKFENSSQIVEYKSFCENSLSILERDREP